MRYDWEMARSLTSEQKKTYLVKLYAMEKEMHDKEIERLKEERKRIEMEPAKPASKR